MMADQGVNHMIGFGPPGKRFQGAVVTVKGEPLGPNETIYFDASDAVFFIGRALEALKIPRIIRREPAQVEGLIVISFQGGFPE